MSSQRFYGVYRGSVFDNRDPYNNNRLKIIVPQILGSTPTEWAWGIDNSSVKVSAPAIGQGVLVVFEGGDPLYPIWIGTFGKAATSDKAMYVSTLSSSTSLTELTNVVKTKSESNGATDIDVTATLLALAHGTPTVSTTAPSNPIQGSIWFNSTNGKRYTYYGTAWVQT